MVGQYYLARCYAYGTGIESNPANAYFWYQKSADQGYIRSQRDLGCILWNGIGVAKDHSKALEVLHKAAEQGDAKTQYELGMIYHFGYDIVKVNRVESTKWYFKAAELGYSDAQMIVAELYMNGDGVVKDLEKSYMWYKNQQSRVILVLSIMWVYLIITS